MGIALERELEDDEEDEILKNGEDGGSKKRTAQDAFGDLLDTEDLEKDIQDMAHEEMDMLKSKTAEEDDELETDAAPADENKGRATPATRGDKPGAPVAGGDTKQRPGSSAKNIIELLDDEADDYESNSKRPRTTIANIRELYRTSGILARLKIDPQVQFDKLRMYTLQYPGPSYGLIMVACNGRVVVKAHHSSDSETGVDNNSKIPKIGSIIVGVNGYLIP